MEDPNMHGVSVYAHRPGETNDHSVANAQNSDKMTSVELFRQPKALPKPEVREWGTGDLQAEALDKVWVPTRPTWHHSGEDKEQKYTLTSLALSNVRMTDQLLPDPKECNMGPLLINKPFHAEHPYSSHIPRTALIPKFDSPQDPKRGVQARSQRPINSEMPACPYDVTIVSKTKGSGLRHEVQDLPRDADKRPLVWLGEDGFNQVVKARGERQQYYPFPPKLVAPNLQDRPADMMVSPRTADTLRNVERGQWKTTYNLTHTGLGDANAMVLDNYGAKMEKLREDGTEDDDLYPAFMPTFDPPRPMEGRIARRLASEPDPQTTEVDKAVETRKTLNEIEEERLLNGRMYVSLPQEEDSEENNGRAPKGFPAQSAIAPTTEQSSSQQQQSYLETMKREQDQKFQQIEAQNRFKDLETRTPQNDIELLNVKYHHVKDKELPPAFYDHEAKYNEERAGLYQTSYDPYRLYNSMDEQAKSGPVLMDTMLSHVDAIHVDSDLNSQMADARQYGAVVNEQQRLTNLTPPRDIILAHEQKKQSQKEWLQPTINSARVSVEEGGTINTESTKGDSFDVMKYRQEKELPRFAKRDPQRVMSHENQNLNNVRVVSTEKPIGKSVRFEDETDVQPVCRPRSRAERPNTIQYTSRHAMWKRENECHDDNAIVPVPGISDILRREKTMPCSTAVVRFSEARPTTSLGKRNDFASRSTNIAPSNLSKSFSEFSSYKNQFPVYDLDYKDDARFKWAPGHGTPRPQTTLLQIQDSFSKSQVQRRFHETFREGAPDLRHSIQAGKKHSFDGVNCQVLHG